MIPARLSLSATDTDPNKPHYLDFQTARVVDNDPMFELRNGGVVVAKFVWDVTRAKALLATDEILEDTAGAGVTIQGVTLRNATAILGAGGARPSVDFGADLGTAALRFSTIFGFEVRLAIGGLLYGQNVAGTAYKNIAKLNGSDLVELGEATIGVTIPGTMRATGGAGQYAGTFVSTGPLNDSNGVQIDAGTSSSDVAFRVREKSTTATYLSISGDGRVTVAHIGGFLGFYGTTPIGRPTGVAVSAAGIHAALVSLGLITA